MSIICFLKGIFLQMSNQRTEIVVVLFVKLHYLLELLIPIYQLLLIHNGCHRIKVA